MTAKVGHIDIINELLQRKIDVNAATKVVRVNLILNCQTLTFSSVVGRTAVVPIFTINLFKNVAMVNSLCSLLHCLLKFY